jgi:hypothetical protein
VNDKHFVATGSRIRGTRAIFARTKDELSDSPMIVMEDTRGTVVAVFDERGIPRRKGK